MSKSKDRKKLKREERWLVYPYRLAHHPLCSKFEDHVYTIKGYKVCRGCVNLYSGFLVGIIIVPILAVFLNINFWIAFIATNVLFIFTPLSVFLHPPRVIKDFTRFLLGIAMVTCIATIIISIIELARGFNGWALAVIFVTITIYITSRRYFTRLRDRRNEQICRKCEQFYHPRCEGLVSGIDRAIALESHEKGDAFSEQ